MTLHTRLILLSATLALTGCAAHPNPPTTTHPLTQSLHRAPTTAESPLTDILPNPTLATTRPSTKPAPLASLDLYAQAREAMLDNRRYTAIALLQQAIKLDPDSFELYYSLGRASYQPGSPTTDAAAAFEHAAQLDPQNLDVRIQLARIYIADADSAKAITHLRLATQSDAYRKGNSDAALVDLLLARALTQKGYYRAALDQYSLLIDRLNHAGPSIRANAELLYLLNRPELLLQQTSELYDLLGDYDDASQGYAAALERDPTNFELHTHLVHSLTAQRNYSQAATRAADAVRLFHASPESLDLLRSVYQKQGHPEAITEQLTLLHHDDPHDRSILYALADTLASQSKSPQAESLLTDQLESQHYDPELVRRLFHLYQQEGQVADAARLLIQTMAANPDSMRQTAPMWDDLLRFSQKNRLRLSTLQKLTVKPSAESARLYWVSRVAELWNRDQLSKTSLEQAVKLSPPLPSAYRDRLAQIWSDPDTTPASKTAASESLIHSADTQGQPALAAELQGLLYLNQKQPANAIQSFDQAVKLGRPSIDLQLNYFSALVAQGQSARAEQTLWRTISDNPTYDEAYSLLFQYYLNQNDGAQAVKVLQTWLTADPTSLSARILQASVYLQTKHPAEARAILDPLFDQYPDNPEVLGAVQTLYLQTNQLDAYIQKLEAECKAHPQNRSAAEHLVRLYAAQNRTAAATRILDAMQASANNDVDYLYYLSHLYEVIGAPVTGEQLLQTCLTLDPSYSPAANDLGYTWADQGKNLPRAESLIRLAVAAEPDNQSYLDSLGWVLYKTGNFPDAAKYLQQAVNSAVSPDPIVLDHLGDALYRLGQRSDAIKQWQRSTSQLSLQSDREDTKSLKQHLDAKLKQPPPATLPVAPLGSESSSK
jgi:predicted Zn-dependent protease